MNLADVSDRRRPQSGADGRGRGSLRTALAAQVGVGDEAVPPVDLAQLARATRAVGQSPRASRAAELPHEAAVVPAGCQLPGAGREGAAALLCAVIANLGRLRGFLGPIREICWNSGFLAFLFLHSESAYSNDL